LEINGWYIITINRIRIIHHFTLSPVFRFEYSEIPPQIHPRLAFHQSTMHNPTGYHATIKPKAINTTAAIPAPELREAPPVNVKGPVGVGEALIPPLADVFTTPPCVDVDDPTVTGQTVVYKLRVSVVRWPPLEYVSVVYTVEVKDDSGDDVG
jgi:hypothetical protein